MRNQQLEQAIASLEQQLALLPKLDRQRLAYQERLVVIGKIQQARNQVTHLLNLLPAMVPEGVYLDQVSLTARRVALQGEGDSNGQLAMLLARAEQSPWISDVAMHSIVARDGERDAPDNIRFSASFQLRSPQTERAGTQPKGGRHE